MVHAESSHLDGDQVATVSDGVSDLQDLRRRIKAIEKAMKREISGSGNEILTKDIILDQISECSSYGISRRDTIEADGQMLELWETTDQDASIDLMVGKGQKVDAVPTDHSQTH
ncbi:PREDICTED: NETWORKED [Prunus dulcis]|uniref:PREDICTED: NETWORKED n=1 Tax=Prunus dulcis TaxID=3755 RepID=A0A5E4EY24_PRUDU|nr:PREDICTED: NETWORKED [Prunus dulcis]